jgi:hypothetical protein
VVQVKTVSKLMPKHLDPAGNLKMSAAERGLHSEYQPLHLRKDES